MILSRLDLYDTTCLQEFTKTTLNSTFFTFAEGNEDVTLFYGCSPLPVYKPENQFYCDVDGDFDDAYYLIGPVPSDPILGIVNCSVGVTVPILETTVDRLVANRSLLQEVLKEGFNVNYRVPFSDECGSCVDLGGACGFDSGSGQPLCVCGERICASSIADKKKKKKTKTLAIVLGVGGGAAALLILVLCLLYIRKRKVKIAAQTTSKSLPTPDSSKGPPTTTSSSLLQSTPSYQSSKSDFGNGSMYLGVQVFNYSELEEATNNFDASRELGDGGFGTVYYGVLKDGRAVAVKRLYENSLRRIEQFRNEVEILTRLRHSNLVMLFGCTSRHSRELLLVYEYIPNGTVADHLHGNRANSSPLTWPVRLNIAIETASALSYLHATDVIHRDVKTNNILLDNYFHVKVADFGLSRLFPTHATHVSTAPQGTPGYVDPEYHQCYQLTDKSDVYSFGVVLIELISSKEAVDTNRHRYDINLANMAINRIQNQALHELFDQKLGFENDIEIKRSMTSVAELGFRCLQQERDMRPSMDEVFDVLKGIQNEYLRDQKAEVVDIRVDDVGLLKNVPPPLSPESIATDKWVSSSPVSSPF